jgi:hypothetical protein
MSEPHIPQPPPEQVLAQPVVIGDLNAELKQNKRGVNKVTLGLIGAVLLVASFFGGIATHAALAKPAAQNQAASGNPNRPFGNGQFGNGTGRNGNGGTGNGTGANGNNGFRGTAGTIDHVDGTDVYVKTQDGRTVKVTTTDSTQVRITQQGKVTDLKQGQTVVVQGTTGSDGSVSAQVITEGAFRGQG